ncbi:hypothetical protein EPO15_10220 [bacterium]|nr:MAG: hypothetical protein EPO15_10220 [bacterium]
MSGLSRRDFGVLAAGAALAGALFGGLRLAGRTFYWGDLLYIHFAWRALPAQLAQAGALPLWNPYDYLGMPLAAQMQCAAWHPLTAPFHLFGFASALAVYHALSYALTAALWLLALRRGGFSRSAAAAGAVAAALGGVAVSRLPFLNHLGALAFLPAFLLFADAPLPLALSLALSFLAGYPTMTAGGALAAFLLSVRRAEGFAGLAARAGRWAAAAALAAALAGVLLVPALELARGSKRGAGLSSEEALTWSFTPRDLVQLSAPPLIPPADYDPAVWWWKTAYAGLVPGAAALLGLTAAGPAAAAGALVYGAGTALLLLGGTNPVSRGLWAALPPLRYVRYPGNLSYLLVPLLALLCARGLSGRRWAPWALAAALAELAVYAAGAHPTAPAALWTDAGPVVAAARAAAGPHRVLMSPKALHAQRAVGSDSDQAALDLKRRLYGLSNAPYRVESVTGFGEPLVPARQYAFLDFIQSRSGAAEAARWMPWADAGALLTPGPVSAPGLTPRGAALWDVSTPVAPVARAWWFPPAAGAALPADSAQPPDPAAARPLSVARSGPGRLEAAGAAEEAGWLYLAEPLGPGWRAWPPRPAFEPALGAFVKRPVPAGPWRVVLRYDPLSFRLGLSLTLVTLAALGLWSARGLLAEAA